MSTHPYDSLPPTQARRLRRLHRLLGVAVLLALAVGLVWVRFGRATDAKGAALRQGAVALERALTAEADWAPAEALFARAARASVFDPYPVFALELTQQLRQGRLDLRDPALEPVARAMAAGDLAGARRALQAVPESAPGRAWFHRLLDDMAAARAPAADR